MTIGKIKIEISAKEQDIVEHCINLAHSGYKNSALFILSLTAMNKGWNYKTIMSYLKEAGISQS